MRTLLAIGIVLTLAAPLYAESYSWVDDSGAFHFTDDYSRIPKKYRKKVIRRGDMTQEQAQPPATDATADKADAGEPSKTGASEGKAAAKSGGPKQPLYGGKTEDAWRSEAASQEQELNRLEGSLETLRKQASDRTLPRERFNALKKEYEETLATYNQKYEEYNKLLKSAKKAGLPVEMRK